MTNKSSILVTGATGLVGSHLLASLLQKGEFVRAIYRTKENIKKTEQVFSYYKISKKTQDIYLQWVEADITDIIDLEGVFTDIEQVFHCAALVSFNSKDAVIMRKINIEGTANIVNMALQKKIKKFCYVSSIATLDKKTNNNLIDETNEWNPENNNYDYAITKYGGEMEVWRGSQEGLPVIIVKPGVILGSGFWNHNTGNFFVKAYDNFSYYTEGITGFVCVNDVVNAMIQLMKSSVVNEDYILVSENLTYKKILTLIANALRTKPPKIKITAFLASLAWRGALIKSFITRKKPFITRHSAYAALQVFRYSSRKIQEERDFKFTEIKTCIEKIAKIFLKGKQNLPI